MKPQEKPETKPEMKKKCDCGPECTCGCNEGKECTCHNGCQCGKGCCCKSCGGKLIALLIVFLAGMGFNELLHGGFGRCPSKGMRSAAMMKASHGMPHFADGAGTVVIVNADGSADVHHGQKCGCHKHHKDMMNPHHKNFKEMMHHKDFKGKPHPEQGETPFADEAETE